MKAIRVHSHGGPEVLAPTEIQRPEPHEGQLRVRVGATGVNFIEVYQRTGLYPVPLPWTPGSEVAGDVTDVGPGVKGFEPGDRVATVDARGGYAEETLVPADRAVRVPYDLDLELAAAAMLQGMTAHYLTHDTWRLEPGQCCLVHAAAGGVGLLLVQMARRLGARVIGTVSTEEKARLAREAGAHEVVVYTAQDFEVEVRHLTSGRGVDVVYDSVGRTTFEKSLSCLRPLGMLVLYGQSSGVVPPFSPSVLAAKGSLFLTRPVLGHYVEGREALERRAGQVLEQVASGELKVRIDRRLRVVEAAEAHRVLESRQTSGKVLLIP